MNKETMAFLDQNLSFEERAADLVSRMTLEEKATQLKNVAPAIPRLGVSGYNYWREALHGVARQGRATSFPTSLAMANTWNRDLVFRAAEITSTEARGKNSKFNLSYWSPTINMARDPRWGRNEETYGEDPYLTGELGIQFVKGMQGDDPRYLKTIATVKHFVANNVEKERRGGTSVMNESTLRDYYAEVFRRVVEGADPASAMGSYNATTLYRNGKLLYDYIPSNANPYIMQELLRRNWGFTGYVTGDCGAFEDLNKVDAYKQALFPGENIGDIPQSATIVKAFLNGADTDCGSAATAVNVLEAVEKGYITENQLSMNVYNLFLQRMRTGEFDEKSRYSSITGEVIEREEHIRVAEEAAEESWVLLKNNGVLPIGKSVKKVVLAGALADQVVLGDYSGSPRQQITPYEGIAAALNEVGAELNYIGGVTDDTVLMNLKSLKLIKTDGSEVELDLSKAENVAGMTLERGGFIHITRRGTAVIPSVNFEDTESIAAEIAVGENIGGKLKLFYGEGGPQVAEASSMKTDEADAYALCTGEYTGSAGGYNRTADLYISFEANRSDFSIEKYRSELDEADVIIAYAGTTLSDSAEFIDRESIAMPESQGHAAIIARAYPGKTVVALQTVGQVDISSFEEQAGAVLWTSYNGQTQGLALGRVLTGAVNPSGKLTTTWYAPKDLEKMPINVDGEKDDKGVIRYYNSYEIKPSKGFPGRTYQYYSGEAVYPFGYGLSYTEFKYGGVSLDKTEAAVGETIKARVEVTNAGAVAGKEIVQFYVAPPKGLDLPKIQLRAFEKVEFMPGETVEVTAEINIDELRFFDEAEQKMYVPRGEYTLFAAPNSHDLGQGVRFSVKGVLESRLKTAAVIPDGITLYGLVDPDGGNRETLNAVHPNLSAVMTDERVCTMEEISVEYTSGDPQVAVVSSNGTVTAGDKSGVTAIYARVTVGDDAKTVSFPVVSCVDVRADKGSIARARERLEQELGSYVKEAYSPENLARLENIAAAPELDCAVKLSELREAEERAMAAMRAVGMDRIKKVYTIRLENPAYIANGAIDYNDNGIPSYHVSETEISGTVTLDKPYSGIRLKVYEGDREIDGSQLKWQLETLGGTSRRVAAVNQDSGELTVMSNGLVRVQAVDAETLMGGEVLIYVNMQVECEYADDGGGANLEDRKEGASGDSFGANNAGSTGAAFMEYKGIRLANLKQIVLRYSLKKGAVTANFSLDKKQPIASEVLTETGSWTRWREVTLDISPWIDGAADRDGLGNIFLQANSANVDYFRLIYEDINDEIPYKIAAVSSGENGDVKVCVRYVGSEDGGKAVLAAGDAQTEIAGGGEYTVATKAKQGQELNLTVSDEYGKEQSPVFKYKYEAPAERRIVTYFADDRAYDVMFTETERQKLPEINGLTGYGQLVKKSAVFEYEYKGRRFSFKNGWRMSGGSETEACLFFIPEAPCTLTVLFTFGDGRELFIWQNKVVLASGKTAAGELTAVSCQIRDAGRPVYIFGGADNKIVCGLIVDYEGGESPSETTLQTARWEGGFARLYRTADGKTRLASSARGGVWTDVDLTAFAVSDLEEIPEDLGINYILGHKDRLYAACDNGVLVTVTTCPKCNKLQRVCDFDIREAEITEEGMSLSGDGKSALISMDDREANRISLAEAEALAARGAALIDVRSKAEYEAKTIMGAVNIPLEQIEEIKSYDRGATLIFFCSKGIKSAEAAKRAKAMGFENLYIIEPA